MAKAIAATAGPLVDVAVDGFNLGWVIGGEVARLWTDATSGVQPLVEDHDCMDVEDGVRWILEQIPGCADLEIEWVNE